MGGQLPVGLGGGGQGRAQLGLHHLDCLHGQCKKKSCLWTTGGYTGFSLLSTCLFQKPKAILSKENLLIT